MAIKELAAGTAAKLRSAQVITDAVSVAKELIDNALDAKADSVAIMVSDNVLDMIKVVDNGAGIAKEDRSSICKRSHTSKIRSLCDLESIGGSSLGFRGEALASIAELSGKGLVVTTRTKEDDTAMKLTINSKGMLQREDSSNGGRGTIVQVQEFLQGVPVRRKLAIQNIKRHRGSLKHLVKSYALARPGIRFELRVIGSKEKDAGFIYAPPRTGTASISAAALILFGKPLSSACVSVRWPEDAGAQARNLGFAFEAVLLAPTASPDKPADQSNHGQYVSIDSRPISTKRGIGKEIVKLYKDELKSARDGFVPTSTPFIALNVSCPVQSYDVNVEPAKDDVAFVDAGKVQELLMELFKSIYATNGIKDATIDIPEPHPHQGATSSLGSSPQGPNSVVSSRAVSPQIENRPVRTAQAARPGALWHIHAHAASEQHTDHPGTEPVAPDDNIRHLARRGSRVQTTNVLEEGEEVPLPRHQFDHLEQNERLPQAITNPWTLARLTKPPASRALQPASSDPIVPGPFDNIQPQMPPTPLSSQKPYRELFMESYQSNSNAMSSPSPRKPSVQVLDDVDGQDLDEPASPPPENRPRQPRSQPRQRQLNWNPAPREEPQIEPDRDEILGRWLAPRQDHSMSSQPNTKPESSPGITLDDIPDARDRPRQQRQRGPVAPFKPVGPPPQGVPQTIAANGRRDHRGHGMVMKMTNPAQSDGIGPSAAATTSKNTPSRQGCDDSSQCVHSSVLGYDAHPVVSPLIRRPHNNDGADDKQPVSLALLDHKPSLSCNGFMLASTETIQSIWAASAKLEPLQTIGLRQNDSGEPEPMTFLECTEGDVYQWDALLREMIQSRARPKDNLSAIELDIEEALSKLY